jgi:hypothetical protein
MIAFVIVGGIGAGIVIALMWKWKGGSGDYRGVTPREYEWWKDRSS